MSLPRPDAAPTFTPRLRETRERPALASLAWPPLAPATPRARPDAAPRPAGARPVAPAFVRPTGGDAAVPPGRLELTTPGCLVHAGAGLRAGAVIQPGRPGHFGGAHEAAGGLRPFGRLADGGCGAAPERPEPLAAAARFEDAPGRIAARAQARGGLGWVELSARFQAPGDSLLPAALAGGGWMDRLTVHASALEGQAGELSVALQLNAALQAGSNGVAAARFLLGLWVDGVAVRLLPAPAWGGRPQRGEPVLEQTVGCLVVARLPVVFGRPFDLGVFVLARAGAEPALPPPPVLPSTAMAAASVGGLRGGEAARVVWAGFRGVHAAGRERPLMHFKQYRVESATGTDWRLPIAP
jgi:hypothetical protein